MVLTIPQLQAKMNNLKQINQHKIIGSAIYKSALPMVDAQKTILNAKTKKKTGNLDASIGRVKVPIQKAREIGAVRVGPRVGGKYRGNHGHLIEFGTKDRYTKAGKYTGKGPRLPFVAPAFLQQEGNVRSQIAKNMQTILNRWVKTGRIAEV
jgi:hypothetical protein